MLMWTSQASLDSIKLENLYEVSANALLAVVCALHSSVGFLKPRAGMDPLS